MRTKIRKYKGFWQLITVDKEFEFDGKPCVLASISRYFEDMNQWMIMDIRYTKGDVELYPWLEGDGFGSMPNNKKNIKLEKKHLHTYKIDKKTNKIVWRSYEWIVMKGADKPKVVCEKAYPCPIRHYAWSHEKALAHLNKAKKFWESIDKAPRGKYNKTRRKNTYLQDLYLDNY